MPSSSSHQVLPLLKQGQNWDHYGWIGVNMVQKEEQAAGAADFACAMRRLRELQRNVYIDGDSGSTPTGERMHYFIISYTSNAHRI